MALSVAQVMMSQVSDGQALSSQSREYVMSLVIACGLMSFEDVTLGNRITQQGVADKWPNAKFVFTFY